MTARQCGTTNVGLADIIEQSNPSMAGQTKPQRFKRPASVLVVVFTRAGEFLLMQRTRPAHFWQSVTGSLRPGENPRLAAVRELREETGLLGSGQLIDLHQSRLFPIIRAWRARYRKNHCFNREYWFALPLPGRRLIRLNTLEHSDYQWLHLGRALELASSRTNRDAMRLLAGGTLA
ncbi:Dihydroneopterin triphosphate pyrophosphatase [Thiorhodovibrio winogradskyi]|uniref:Dihydroneopterin triphosphate pyrophosphatase n=1 Tax=Thiorhodovibrio winogradskyi TaxID=77007 RepID=A0ABZ0SDD3_9GAMM|nr:dihydroneopterin triphosphate diphosphatase [Thiorhodovibrio winogradskyi]